MNCEVCGSSLTSSRELKSHKEVVHGRVLAVCEVCGRDFKGKLDLKCLHQANHGGLAGVFSLCLSYFFFLVQKGPYA